MDRHDEHPLTFRPPRSDRRRLDALVGESGKPRNAVLSEALRLYLDASEGDGQMIRQAREALGRDRDEQED